MSQGGFTNEQASAVRYTGAQDEEAGYREDKLVIHSSKTPACAQMTSLVGLSQFGSLRELGLVGMQLNSLDGIQEVCGSLTSLRIDSCLDFGLKALDMTPVLSCEFKSLRQFALRAVGAEVVVIPVGMRDLEEFSLWDEKSSTAVEFQGKFPVLKKIRCQRAIGLKCLTGVKNCSNLEELSLYGSRFCCFPVDLPQTVRKLDLSYSGVPLLHISYLRELRSLKIAANALNDLVGIEDLTTLEELDVSNNCLNNLQLLQDLVNLKSLNAANNKVRMLHGLESMQKLEELYCQDNEVQNLLPLAACFSLKKLGLNSNRIRELQGLEKLINLQTLELSDNRIQAAGELTILVNFQQLKELGILGNPIALKKEGLIVLAQSLSIGCTKILKDDDAQYIQKIIKIRNGPKISLPEAKAKVYRTMKPRDPIIMEAHFKTIKDAEGQYTTIETLQLGNRSQAVQHERGIGAEIRSTAVRTIQMHPKCEEQKYQSITSQISQSMQDLNGTNLELIGGSAMLPATLKGGKNSPVRQKVKKLNTAILPANVSNDLAETSRTALSECTSKALFQDPQDKLQQEEELKAQREENRALRSQNEELMKQVLQMNQQILEMNKNTQKLIREIGDLKEKLIKADS